MKILRILALLLTLTVTATVNAATISPTCLNYGAWTWKVIEKEKDGATTYAFSIVVISGCRDVSSVSVTFAAYDNDGIIRGRTNVGGPIKPGPNRITGTEHATASEAKAIVRWEIEEISGY
jgi:hypothetical protein